MSTPDARTLNTLEELRLAAEAAEADHDAVQARVRSARADERIAFERAVKTRSAHYDAVEKSLGLRTKPLWPESTNEKSRRARNLAIAVMVACVVIGGFVGHFLWTVRL